MSGKSTCLYRTICLAAWLLFCAIAAHAQYGNMGYYNQANKLFKEKNYFEAAQCYEKYLAAEKKSKNRAQPFAVEKKIKGKTNLDPHEEAVYQLAECYRLSNDYAQAEKKYSEAASFSSKAYPLCQYWYGVSLRANGKYKEAMEAITKFLQEHTGLDEWMMGADRELESLKYIQSQLAKSNKDRFVLLPQNNSGNTSAYALTIKNEDTVVFTSIHADASTAKGGKTVYLNDLYESAGNETLSGKASRISMSGNKGLHNGLACFADSGRRMFFTRWAKKDGRSISVIYSCYRTDTGWSAPVKLADPVNIDGYSSAQPFVTKDGRYLLFSSDRPGGAGNYDIWYASLDSNWQAYTVGNMGTMINTAGDEESPFYHQQSRTLVFASNGRTGMGGFDIYYAKNDFSFTHWSQPQNPGMPLNSSRDDLYFISTDDDNLWNSGWLSSDRATGCCLALFSVRENNKQFVSGSVLDCESKKPLPGVQLTVRDTRHHDSLLARYSTDSSGHYAFELKNASRFVIKAEKQGYVPQDKNYTIHFESLADTVQNEAICLRPIESGEAELAAVLKALSRSTTVGHFGYKKAELNAYTYANLDSLAGLMRKYPSVKIQIGGYTDAIGGEQYNIKLSQARVDACIRYLIKKGIDPSRLVGKAFGECCPIEPDMINGKDNPAGREKNRRVEYKLLQGND